MESTLPPELLASPVPPVALIGLDAMGSHAKIWKAMAEGGVSARSLRWLLIEDPGNDLPKSPKARRTSYEWFIPKGIIKTNWMTKHLNQVPSVAVIFIDLEWNSADWNERKQECAARVQAVRAALNGRGTKIALVLIQRNEMTPPAVGSEESTASERAATLCSACELSARSLFVLPINAENLSGFIHRLESAFYELAQNYYHQEIRGVKSHKDYLNKTTHLYLFVRHQFKAGFLSELKRDMHASYKHYSSAYNLLMEVRATDTNIMEVKTVGGFINFKICKLAFQLNLPRDAISQFRRHMDIFQHRVGLEELSFEHRGWQSNQCSTFAEIFADAIKHGLPAIQTQHPGLFYQQAAQYAIQRRKLAEELCGEAMSYPEPDPLINEHTLEFFGQRPWRPGKVSIEPPDMELEQKGISALVFREKTMKPTHSEIIVDLLKKAIDHYRTFRSPRAESNLTVTMAEELVFSQRCTEALELLKPIVNQYRKESWSILLKAALKLALKCAYLVAAVPEYVAYALELSSNDIIEDDEEKCRVFSNVCRLLETPAKIPSAEPGLTSKSERAAVGEATKKWTEIIKSSSGKVLNVELSPEVFNRAAIKIKVAFEEKSFKANQTVGVSVYLCNNVPESAGSSCFLPITSLQLGIQWLDSKDKKTKAIKELKWEAGEASEEQHKPIELSPGKSHRQHFELNPASEDVGKKLVAHHVILRLGNGGSDSAGGSGSLTMLLDIRLPCEEAILETLAESDFSTIKLKSLSAGDTDDVDGKEGHQTKAIDLDSVPLALSCVDINQRDPKMEMKVVTNDPALIGEWFKIYVNLSNNEKDRVEDVSVIASLEEASDPLIADTTRLTLDYKSKEPETPMTPDDADGNSNREFAFVSPPAIKKITGISAGDSTEIVFFIKSSTTGIRGININVTYKVEEDSTKFECHLEEKLNLETTEPFLIASELLSCRTQLKLETAYSDEPFLIVPEVKALSSHSLRILNSSVEVRPPMKSLNRSTISQLAGCTMYKDSVANECYAIQVQRQDLASSSLDVQDLTLGKYIIKWIREDEASANKNEADHDTEEELLAVSTYELQSVRVCQSSLYAEAYLPAFATARIPFGLEYVLKNKTDVMLEFNLAMEPSEAFMLSGNKQQHFKIPPGASYKLNFVLYPLLAGEAVALPVPKLSSLRPVLPHDDVGATLQRLLPSTITVLPRSRGNSSPNVEKKSLKVNENSSTAAPFYRISSPVFVAKVPFRLK